MNDKTLTGDARRAALRKFLAAILLAFGLFFIVPSQYEINQATQAKDWKPRQAHITHSKVRVWESGRGGDARGPRYEADIRGELVDSGRTFEIERIAFGQFATRDYVTDYVDRYRPGNTAEVYVSPDDPDRVVLVRDADVTAMYLLVGLGLALVLGALYLYLTGRRLARRA